MTAQGRFLSLGLYHLIKRMIWYLGTSTPIKYICKGSKVITTDFYITDGTYGTMFLLV